MGSKKFGVLEEATAHLGVVPHASETAAHTAAQKLQVVVGRIGQYGVVQVSPERFDRIELGRIGGEPLDAQPPTVALQRVLSETATVGGEAIPEQENSPSPVTAEGSEEAHEVGTADASRMKGQEPTQTLRRGCGEHEADARQALPVERLAQAGCPTLGGPSGANRRSL